MGSCSRSCLELRLDLLFSVLDVLLAIGAARLAPFVPKDSPGRFVKGPCAVEQEDGKDRLGW